MIKCISPIDGSIFSQQQIFSKEEALLKINRAKLAQKEWMKVPLKERITKVGLAITNLGKMNDEIVVELAHMMGRPVRYQGEFGGVQERTTYIASVAEQALQDMVIESSNQFDRRIVREPHGIVFVIAPWNYPYLTSINTIVPALIAGNAVILKHASQTFLVGSRLEKIFHQAGIPQDIFQNFFLDHEKTIQLISSNCFDFINFTGSVEGGKVMEKAAAGTFTPMGLELGGKDPGYVMEDANLDNAVATLIDAAMYNSGQCCCGIERIYVCEKYYDSFVQKAVELVSTYKLGNPLDLNTTIGPMAHVRFAQEVRRQTNEALSSGAKAMIDPNLFPKDNGAAYLMPQILTKVDHSMRIMKEESFGPVVGIMKVKNDQEAISLMNDSPYGLTASLWTNDYKRARTIGSEIETGTVFTNRADYLDPALCWTGCKETGRGGTLSIIGYQNLTRVKSYHMKKENK